MTGVEVIISRHKQLRFKRNSQPVVGAWIATPGFIRDEVKSLNTEIYTMERELGEARLAWNAANSESVDTWPVMVWYDAVWLPFLHEWDAFYTDHGKKVGLANWYHNFWGSTWTRTQDFRKRLIDLRKSAETMGATFTAPVPTPPKEGWLDTAGNAVGDVWMMLKIAGIIALGFGALFLFGIALNRK